MTYATLGDFAELYPDYTMDDDVVERMLERACDEVDALCYGRIRSKGVAGLTAFQQEKVKKAVCYHAAFLCEYGENLDSPLSSYGINGVSMSFSAERTVTQGGITTIHPVMAQLRQSGLASRLIL